MARLVDRTGLKYGRLTALSIAEIVPRKGAMWLCACECGRDVVVEGAKLSTGNTKSCGCLMMDLAKAATPPSPLRHGHSVRAGMSSEYKSWRSMKARCLNQRTVSYPRYGGRGIGVCQRWMTFDNFLADMGPKPSPTHTIERIDSNGHYEPGNCRWASKREQARNLRSNRLVDVGGRRITLQEAIDASGVPKGTVSARLSRGHDLSAALSKDHLP